MDDEAETVWRAALEIAAAILDGSVKPYPGARAIWLEVMTQTSSDELLGILAPFVAGATDWVDHPEARSEIEDKIRNDARALIQRWGIGSSSA